MSSRDPHRPINAEMEAAQGYLDRDAQDRAENRAPGHGLPIKGRGAASNHSGRFESNKRLIYDDGWGTLDEPPLSLHTQMIIDKTRSVISWNDSPDIPFDRSINPYRGCEHGCIYCYARPSHAYLGYSPGLDFESRLLYKPDAAELLRKELGKRGYTAAPIALGANTDPYQPVERKLRVTRGILEVLNETAHPVRITTKGGLIERDLALLEQMRERNLISVNVSLTTLEPELSRRMEPRAASPARRLQIIRLLSERDIPVSVFASPMIPALNDAELESILQQAREAGAGSAAYIFIRLPRESASLWQEWLANHYPDRAEHVMARIRESRGGRDYEAGFGTRMRGRGIYADLLRRRFEIACKRLGYSPQPPLRCDQFRPPNASGQLQMF